MVVIQHAPPRLTVGATTKTMTQLRITLVFNQGTVAMPRLVVVEAEEKAEVAQ
jgi:hypothetical protein